MTEPAAFDLDAILTTIAQTAARLLGSFDARILLVEEDSYRPLAHFGPQGVAQLPQHAPGRRPLATRRAMTERRPVQIEDLQAVPGDGGRTLRAAGARTTLT